MSAPMSPLLRFSRILEERGVPLMPALKAVELAGDKHTFIAVSALHPRVSLLLPYSADVLAAVAPGVSAGTLPARPMLKVNIEGDRVEVGIIAIGAAAPAEAVDVAPSNVRAAWLNIVEALPALPNARITSRLRYLTHDRATISMFYDRRAPDLDARLVAGVDQASWSLGVGRAHRELWKKTHPTMGGSPVTVTTACTQAGPAPELAYLYREGTWDQAIELCKVVASLDKARGGALVLGSIAGLLGVEKTEGVELTFASDGPDVAVWLMPQVR